LLLPLCVLLAGFSAPPSEPARITLASPDGHVKLFFQLLNVDGLDGCPTYRLAYKGVAVLHASRLGLLTDDTALDHGFSVSNETRRRHDAIWIPVYGERSSIRDAYNEVVIELKTAEAPRRRLQLTFRAFNAGIALRYTLPGEVGAKKATIREDRTRFRFPADLMAWTTTSSQGRYSELPLSRLPARNERPMTLRVAEDLYAAVGEACMVNFSRMRLTPVKGKQHTLGIRLDGPVIAPLPLTTPWRIVMTANSPGALLEQNDIFLNLNEPCALKDTSWIRPGKVIREVTLTTAGGRACVDFAVRNNLQYVEFDAGWYGHEYHDTSDATTITVDPKRSPGPLDLHGIIRYAKERGIGVILYVNRRALERQLDAVLPLYRKWGVAGVKYGFVRTGSQQWTSWLHEAVRKAARHRLMVDVHDDYRPVGYSRTYPNLMTQEGIGGDETSPTNRQTLTILFTRMIAGAGDNTICYYDPRVDRNATHAYQLAKAVCIYSPWQFLFWYDRPPASPRKKGGAGGNARVTGDEPELEFYAHVPTVWDDTRVIHGNIGRYAVIARRSGESWYLGCMNSGKERTLKIPLKFLRPGKRYIAHVYSDDPTIPTRTHVRIARTPVTSETVLTAPLSAQGGMAARLHPVDE
jgi:alpha-glucosidase